VGTDGVGHGVGQGLKWGWPGAEVGTEAGELGGNRDVLFVVLVDVGSTFDNKEDIPVAAHLSGPLAQAREQ